MSMTQPQKATTGELNKLSEDEIALYDRQIRLWGMAAQANMRSAKVLLVNLGSLGTEITKNIVLSGIGHLTILDSHIVTEEDLGSQFFLSKDDVGKSRLDAVGSKIKDLNPKVTLEFDNGVVECKNKEYFSQFDLIIGTELNKTRSTELNKITRSLKTPLYLAASNGLFSYIFVDLIQFDAVDEKIQSMKPTTIGKVSSNREIIDVQTYKAEDDEKIVHEKITTRNYYKSFEDMLQTATLEGKLNKRQLKKVSSLLPLTFTSLVSDIPIETLSQEKLQELVIQVCEKLGLATSNISNEYVEQFQRQTNTEFAPVSAIIGGALSQDVINILGKKQAPLNNFIIFDGITLEMRIFEL
ncbi:E1 ubiquitin-activating protein AOS1 NDAI_0J00350 [Naumovozyma dairenensis CBS 421]|uniref:Ubiquitin-like 1-activating enzyme E1A n=1 Tax=Naumovozyma dairenensis (strain ATCC 10597 / BCRC 20456 / CBS 421 / NBRC 0211 / NRRL Y-12639) TaxID=1071378 RepID=G0WGJ9_NAUDC|nr:hypothetical protein NDAI_0J00350 [Naumovozyma dairenensis CBS 421]CCD26927.1 hypothetical protein NDAI_0J00350 [Naumovozyma dairenensis CBS 421]